MKQKLHVNYGQVYKKYQQLSIKYSVKKYFIVFGVEFLSNKFSFSIPCVSLHERIALVLDEMTIFLVRKVVILRWLVTDQQVSYLCKFVENVNQS